MGARLYWRALLYLQKYEKNYYATYPHFILRAIKLRRRRR
jgi:hypothetical protein